MKLYLLISTLLLASCASVEMGKDFEEADFSWIVEGQTTMKEVVDRMGKPWIVTKTMSGGRQLQYQHITSSSSALNASVLNPFSTRVDTETDTETCTVLVDSEGLVISWEYVGPDVE
jgi:hypothetical protein